MTRGDDVVAWARTQLGVPWRHQGRSPGVALDCAGLVICAARALGLVAPDFDVNGYSRVPDGSMMRFCSEHMTQLNAPEAGAVVVLATRHDPQHMGLLAPYRHGGWAIIHASNAGRPEHVAETRLMFCKTMTLRGYFRLPGVEA